MNMTADTAEFLEAHAPVFDWLESAKATSDFARSLLSFFDRTGYLTPRQIDAVARQLDRGPAPVASPKPAGIRADAFWTVLQRHAKFYAGKLTISRRNADQLCWIKHEDAEKVVGKIDGGAVTLWSRPGINLGEVRSMIEEFEGAPLQSAMKFGKLAGRCCSCGRELTDPESIARGIGPICAGKFE